MIRVVTLLSDFGLADPYVGEVKARLYAEWSRFPDPHPLPALVDLTHAIPPGDIAAGSWALRRSCGDFPAGSVHLAIVDPGVGTDRPAIAVAARGQLFVGPGNGLFAFLAADAEPPRVALLDKPLYHRGPGGTPSTTFHGRDIFAPAAAHLAMGVPLTQVGSLASVELLGRLPAAVAPLPAASGGARSGGPAGKAGRGVAAASAGETLGSIVWIDHFGNAITDIEHNCPAGRALDAGAVLLIGDTTVEGPVATFAVGSTDAPFWYWGSGGTLEAALRGADAAARCGWRIGMAVRRAAP